ncbi:MAG: adenylosuccinate lyase [Planctomycetes bacterium]|nr:adenylosuccinate lyase [Planctomycetota bacterium]
MMQPDDRSSYVNPLVERYASPRMLELFSPRRKFVTWRRLWIALAAAEKACGLAITDDQIRALEARVEDIPWERAAALERELRHDVMAHVHAYGEQCPAARPILHLGATSCYVTDNADLLLFRAALDLVRSRLLTVLHRLARFAETHRDVPTLAYTHLQPAQPTTVGRRACLWIQDLVADLEDLVHVHRTLPFLGAKGTTGTQESFLKLFGGDEARVEEVDRRVAEQFGFERRLVVSGQTYPRKIDSRVAGVLSGIAQSAAKFAADVRLAQSFQELFEPVGARQIGSSAMPYKRNPMKAERISALARFVIVGALNPGLTAAAQWFERTLDDSANRRLVLPEIYLAVDAILVLYAEIAAGLEVNRRVIARRLAAEVPFLATEELLMAATAAGGDRQALHEKLRRHAVEARRRMVEEGAPNDLFARVAADPDFAAAHGRLPTLQDPARFTGRARTQASRYLAEVVRPLLAREQPFFREEDEATRV